MHWLRLNLGNYVMRMRVVHGCVNEARQSSPCLPDLNNQRAICILVMNAVEVMSVGRDLLEHISLPIAFCRAKLCFLLPSSTMKLN